MCSATWKGFQAVTTHSLPLDQLFYVAPMSLVALLSPEILFFFGGDNLF